MRIEGMEMRLQQMSSSQRERLAAENAEEREVRLQHDSEPQGAASARNTWRPVTSPTYSTACRTSQDANAHMAALEVSSTHRIICLPLLTWNDTCLGDPHPICDQCFFPSYVHV